MLHGVARMPLFDTDGINPDLFGDAYEYLMGMYAANAGKKGGQYFTPADVSELLARLGTIGKTRINKVSLHESRCLLANMMSCPKIIYSIRF